MLDPQVRALLEAPNFVHVATLMADGSPQSVAVWRALALHRAAVHGALNARRTAAAAGLARPA
jgi:hypothetical protein